MIADYVPLMVEALGGQKIKQADLMMDVFIAAEEVLSNGRGVCMQKCNLLVAMAREAGLQARLHFM